MIQMHFILDAIIKKMSAEIQELRSGPREGMREKFPALRAKYDVQFKEVLTEEQFEGYSKAREAASGQWGSGKGKGNGKGKSKGDGKGRPSEGS